MPFDVLLHPSVPRRLRKKVPPRVADAFQGALGKLAGDPYAMLPDQRTTWERPYPTLTNHRHVDLPMGWRLSYTVANPQGQAPRVVVLWFGTHKEYERKYGFKTH